MARRDVMLIRTGKGQVHLERVYDGRSAVYEVIVEDAHGRTLKRAQAIGYEDSLDLLEELGREFVSVLVEELRPVTKGRHK